MMRHAPSEFDAFLLVSEKVPPFVVEGTYSIEGVFMLAVLPRLQELAISLHHIIARNRNQSTLDQSIGNFV